MVGGVVLLGLLVPGCDKECDPCIGACVSAGRCTVSDSCECTEQHAGAFGKDPECECTGGTNSECCIAVSDADCLGSENCRSQGLCTLFGEGCVAGSDADCRNSEGCASRGNCVHSGNMCVPGSDADCLNSEHCVEEQRGCVLCTDASCQDECAWINALPCCSSP